MFHSYRTVPPPRQMTALVVSESRLHMAYSTSRKASQPFDLGAAPLLRASLVRLGARDWAFLISAHHLVADAWSAGLVLRELLALYDGAPLAPPPLQFADAVHWEEQRSGIPERERDLAWWRTHLADPPALRLPTDFVPSAGPEYRGASEAIELPEPLSRALADLARREGVTLFSLMLASWNLLLHRYSGAADLCVGTSVVGRPRCELEDIVGFFANLIVLRFEQGLDCSFRDLLAGVHREVLDGFAHEAPFDAVV